MKSAALRRCLFGAMLMLVAGMPGHAQEPAAPRIVEGQIVVDKLGMDCFRHLLFDAGMEPLSNTFEILNQPQDTVIILLGSESSLLLVNNQFETAVRRGATLIVAADRSSNSTFDFGIDYVDGTIRAGKEDALKGIAEYPFIRPIKPFFPIESTPLRELFGGFSNRGDNAIAANTSCVIRPVGRPLDFRRETLAGFPFSSRFNGRAYEPSRDFFAIGGGFGQGRVLFLADHSVFVNNLILRPDIANLLFARGMIEWAQGPQQKKRCLLVEDGVIRTVYPLPTIPPKDGNLLELLLKMALIFEQHGDRMIAEVERRDGFNQFILQKFPMREILRTVMFLVAGFVILLGVFWFMRSRTTADPARTLVTPELAALIPQGDALHQRFEGLMDTGNVYEVVREAVRDFFDGLHAMPTADGQPPRLLIVDDHPEPTRLRTRIMRLWTIAFGITPVEITAADWKSISVDLREILEEADNGSWKFVSQQK